MLSKRFSHTIQFLVIVLSLVMVINANATTTHKKKKHSKQTVHNHIIKNKNKKSKKGKVVHAVSQPSVPITASLQEGVERIVNQFPRLNVGVMVESADNGELLYQHNLNQSFTPASTLKLFTGTAALTYLGPNFVFPTQFITDAKTIQDGKLLGSLYVKFSGDPQLTVADLNDLVNTLVSQGIKQVQGNLVIDDSVMDRDNWAPGWLWNEQTYCYAAPSNAVVLNRNCLGFTVIPAKQSGGLASIRVNPIFRDMSIINQVVTRSEYTSDCLLQLKAAGNSSYVLSGCVRPRQSPVSVGISIHDTRIAGMNVVSGLLRQRGINVLGNIQYNKTPNNLKILAEHDSQPLNILITRMLKKSDNLIADSLYKKLGATYFNTTGNWQNSAQAEQAILGPRTGIDFSKIVIVDGAGLSRYDAVSPAQFGKLLYYGYHTLPNKDIFFQALPISGIDGTLKHRLGGATLGKIHAKTGTMDYTSGLAGYVQTHNHGTLIFAIIINANNGNQGVYHLLQDRICQFLALNAPATVAPAPVNTPEKIQNTTQKIVPESTVVNTLNNNSEKIVNVPEKKNN